MQLTRQKEKYPNLPIEGEIQFDAAVAPRVARTKCPESEVAGHANTFIFLTSMQETSDTRSHRDLKFRSIRTNLTWT